MEQHYSPVGIGHEKASKEHIIGLNVNFLFPLPWNEEYCGILLLK